MLDKNTVELMLEGIADEAVWTMREQGRRPARGLASRMAFNALHCAGLSQFLAGGWSRKAAELAGEIYDQQTAKGQTRDAPPITNEEDQP